MFISYFYFFILFFEGGVSEDLSFFFPSDLFQSYRGYNWIKKMAKKSNIKKEEESLRSEAKVVLVYYKLKTMHIILIFSQCPPLTVTPPWRKENYLYCTHLYHDWGGGGHDETCSTFSLALLIKLCGVIFYC